MIEANEDITLVTERQMRDVEEGQSQAKAIAQGREVHPALLDAASATSAIDPASQHMEVTVQTVQQQPPPSSDPNAAMRHLRLSIVAVIVLVLFFVWIRQKRKS